MKLLDIDRERLERIGHGVRALRIIDAHAAERAVLVTQVAELTRERDEAREDVRAAHQAHADAVNAKQAEVTRLTEALAEADLTDEERRDMWLGDCGIDGQRKALRIIDAHAADRAALEAELDARANGWRESQAQLEAVRRTVEDFFSDDDYDARGALRRVHAALLPSPPSLPAPTHAALVAQVAELTRELAELNSELASMQRARNDATAQVAELTRERDEAFDWRVAKRAEVTRLTEAYRAAEAQAQCDFQLAADWKARYEAAEADATVAQDRLAALRAKVDVAKRLATEALRDSDDPADALAHVLEALRGS